MELTRNEIAVLCNYYNCLKFDLDAQFDILKENCQGIIDTDLYETQLKRYESKEKEYEDRINELQAYADKL